MELKKIIAIEGVLFLVLLGFFLLFSGKKQEIDTDIYIDSTSGIGGEFDSLGFENVKAGIYEITVFYTTDYSDNGFAVTSSNGNYGSINSDVANSMALKSYFHSNTAHVWLREKTDKLTVKFHFCGAGSLEIDRVELKKKTPCLLLFYYLLLLVPVNLSIFEKKQGFPEEELRERRMVRTGLVLITLVASIPLMNDFLIKGTDLAFHLYRIEGIRQGLLSGQFPVRIQPQWWEDYGYAVSVFYPDGLLYFPAVLMILGASLQGAYKMLIVAVNFLTAWIAYRSFYGIGRNKKAALCASALYSLGVYRLIDIYLRAALGEFLALTFLPLVLLGFYRVYTQEKQKYFSGELCITLGLTGCIQTHILTCEMLGFFILIFCVIFIRRTFQKGIFLSLVKALVGTILLNLWFLVPFLNLYFGDYNVKSAGNFVGDIQARGAFPSQLGSMFVHGLVADKTAADGTVGEMGQTVGIALLLGLIGLGVVQYIYREKKYRTLTLVFISFGFLSLAMTLCFFPYGMIANRAPVLSSLIGHIQFPWRFLGLATLFLSGCSMLLFAMKKSDIIKACFLVLAFVSAQWFYYQILDNESLLARYYEFQGLHHIMDQTEYLKSGSEYSGLFHEPVTSEAVEIMDYQRGKRISFAYMNGKGEGYIDLPLFFYDCYVAEDETTGQRYELTYGENNCIRVLLPPEGAGKIRIRIKERKLWRLSEIISLFSAIGLILYLLWGEKLKEKLKCRTKSPS